MGCRLSVPWMSDGTMGVSAQNLRYVRNHEALRILASYKQPITVQIEGQRGRGLQYHRPSDSSTQTERPWDNVTSDKPCYSHITLPGNRGDGGRYEYLPNSPRDLEDMRTVPRHDPEFSNKAAHKQNCLLSCCNSNTEEPSSFQSQTEDEDYVLEKTVGYLPLHHELDSGLGWTDGSFHQGELSGMETEEGLDECHAHQGGRGARVRGGSPSSESFISSEMSDSGFYSVSTAEFLRFQRLLEKRMRVYNSRLHHQGELQNLCMEAQKAHRELEAIPEALTTQPDNECMETEAHPQQMFRVASVQLRKNDCQCLNNHSSSSAAVFSTCSSPSGQQSMMTPHGMNAGGVLRRSRTLHHRPVHVEQRRRASHPVSPNYSSVTLNRYANALHRQLTEETKTDVRYNGKYCTHHVSQPMHHVSHHTHHAHHPTNHANHLTYHDNHPVHHANHITHQANHPTNHANHITHHANHSTHHASYPTHHANHPTQRAHLANYTTMHANHPTHIGGEAACHANKFTHPTQHANLSPHPYHATLPAQYTHYAHGTLTSHAPHHDYTHATLPTQHTHRINDTHASHSAHHNHAQTTFPNQHAHHAHCTHASHSAQYGHTHTTIPSHDTHHTNDILTTRGTHHVKTHVAPPTQHTHPTQDIRPSHVSPHTHATLPTQHTHHMSRPKHAISQPSLSSTTDDHHYASAQESFHHDKRGRSFTELPPKPAAGTKEECEKKRSGERERVRFHTLSHTPSQEGNDTWPKTTNRQCQYSTLEGHMTMTSSAARKPPSGAVNLRAMRNQLLRERALRLADERSGGISTDDETNVEIQRVGRYWSRSERREQVLQKQRQKRETLRGGTNNNTSMSGDSSGYSVLLELSQRKLSRLRNRKLLDDWTTVEELLTHGTRLGTHDENIQIPNSLLTVTTV